MSMLVQVDGIRYQINHRANAHAKDGVLVQCKDYVNTAQGAYKATDLFNKVLKEAKEISLAAGSPAVADVFGAPGQVFSKLAGAFIFPYAIFTGINVIKAAEKVAGSDTGEGATYENVERLVKDSCAFTTAACYTLLHFIPGATALSSIAKVTDLADDVIDLKQQAAHWVNADNLLGATGPDGAALENLAGQNRIANIQTDLAQKKKLHLFGVIKAVASVVSGIFAVLAMIFAMAIVPAIVSATIGLVAITFTFIKHFYSQNIEHKLDITRVAI